MIKKILAISILIFLSACTEAPSEPKGSDKVEQEEVSVIVEKAAKPVNETPFLEKKRYKETDPEKFNVLIDSSMHWIKKGKKEIEEKMGTEVAFHFRHFLVDSDIINEKEFDAAILINQSPLEKAIKSTSKSKKQKIAEDRLVLIVKKHHIDKFGNSASLTSEQINNITREHNIKIQIANPALELSSFLAWNSFVSKNIENNIQTSEFNHGSLRVLLSKLNEGRYQAAWILESTSKRIQKSFEGKDNPYLFYFIKGKQFYPEYYYYSLNSKSDAKLDKFLSIISQPNFKENLKNISSLKVDVDDKSFSSVNKINTSIHKTTAELVNEFDQYIDQNYPNIHTVYLVPYSTSSKSFQLEHELKNVLVSMNKEQKNIYETISRAREGDKITLIGYNKEYFTVFKNKKMNQLTDIELNKIISMPTSTEVHDPYMSLDRALSESAKLKNSDNSRFRIIHLVSDRFSSVEKTNSVYADYAEKYKRQRLEGSVSKDIEISNIGLGKALMENLNGFTGLSNGIHINANETQFKKSIFIIKNSY